MNDLIPTICLFVAIVGLVLQTIQMLFAVLNAKKPRRNPISRKTKATGPPKFGEYLLYFFLSKADRVSLLGDLEEAFKDVQKKFGRRPANLWYYKQVACSIGPLVWMAMKKLAKWGAVTAVEEWIRRHI